VTKETETLLSAGDDPPPIRLVEAAILDSPVGPKKLLNISAAGDSTLTSKATRYVSAMAGGWAIGCELSTSHCGDRCEIVLAFDLGIGGRSEGGGWSTRSKRMWCGGTPLP
jgi:hypothetical protein